MSFLRRNFVARVFFNCFLGVHIPLIVTVVYQFLEAPTINYTPLILLLLATVVGTATTILAMKRELSPVIEVSDALKAYALSRTPTRIKHKAVDEVGILAESANWAIEMVDSLLRERENQANTDALTGLSNRRAFLESISGKKRGALAVLDIDKFKLINDRLGHSTGDAVLVALSSILENHVRSDDIVARWGGEEFVIYFSGTSTHPPLGALERIKDAVSMAEILPSHPVTFSAGLVMVTGDFDEDFKRADALLYRAKQSGRNRVCSEPTPLAEPLQHTIAGQAVTSLLQ